MQDMAYTILGPSRLWIGIWSDMFIDTTFMRYGHGPGGLICTTLNQSALKRWALSLHACSRFLKDVDEMRDVWVSQSSDRQKEESPARIASDKLDRQKIRSKLDSCIDPLSEQEHTDHLINIVTGRVCPDPANVDNAVELGLTQMKTFESSLPDSFYAPISGKVVNMSVGKKGVPCGSTTVFDSELIYARVMGLASTRDVNMKDVLGFELAPVPTAMFSDDGKMRIANSKSVLKNKMQVISSTRVAIPSDVVVLDGCAVLWCISWPSNGTVQDFIESFWKYILAKLAFSDVYLIFDRYFEYSIKDDTRQNRSHRYNVTHKLRTTTPLPPQQAVLTVPQNKVQLIKIICDQIQHKAMTIPENDNAFRKRLVITGPAEIPNEVHLGISITRGDLRTWHEEADVIICQQVVCAASQDAQSITVVCDDTDVFILLLNIYQDQALHCHVWMEGVSSGRTVIDIAATVKTYNDIIPYLLAAHALTGCDTVATLNGIGKVTMLKMLQKGMKIERLGNRSANFQDVLSEATKFVASCYGKSSQDQMSEVRYEVWLHRMSNKSSKQAVKLKSLPPTTVCFAENVKRAHLQSCIWKSALNADPPELDPTEHGWYKDLKNKVLVPIGIPKNQQPAPDSILQMICCGCSSDQPCAKGRCGCYRNQLACTVFCSCYLTDNCQNRWTKEALEYEKDGCESQDTTNDD